MQLNVQVQTLPYQIERKLVAPLDPVPPPQRLTAYADALGAQVYEPCAATDENAGIFYGSSLRAVGYYSSDEPRADFPLLRLAGPLQLAVLAASPGAPHCVIHAYGQPALAAWVLPVADAFAAVAAGVPHR